MKDIECVIRWKDDGCTEECTIRIDPSYDCENPPADDEEIIYYCTDEQDFANLCTEHSPADFVVESHR